MGEVARRSGLATSTVRAWERRYGLLRPARSAGGHRRYSTADLVRIQRMRRLLAEGWAAAEAAAAVLAAEDRGDDPTPTTTADGVPPVPSAPSDRRGPVGGRPAPDPVTAAGSGDRGLAAATATRTSDARSTSPVPAPVHDAARALLAAERPEDVPFVLVRLVEALGGRVVAADDAPDEALPVDLGLGELQPLVPVAEAPVARLALERWLPALVEDARRQRLLLRRVWCSAGGPGSG